MTSISCKTDKDLAVSLAFQQSHAELTRPFTKISTLGATRSPSLTQVFKARAHLVNYLADSNTAYVLTIAFSLQTGGE